MTPLELGIAVLVAAAALALWLDLRLGDRTPSSIARVLLHAVTALIAVRLAAAAATHTFSADSATRMTAVLVLVVLPSWMYAFLASLWALKLVRSSIPR